MTLLQKLADTKAPPAVILIRIFVGGIFISEGIQKFLFPAEIGAGRFAKIGIPSPEFVAPFVGCFEIACGAFVLLGLCTRLAVVPLTIVMITAIVTTKVPILIDAGFWKAAHEARTDWSMLLALLFLFVVGAGRWSVDAILSRNTHANL